MSNSCELSLGRLSRLTAVSRPDPAPPDMVCLSHLRWGFVFQRPQHLMTRFARDRRVFFIEEPLDAGGVPQLVVRRDPSGVLIAVPHLPPNLPTDETAHILHGLIGRLLREHGSREYVLWYLTPMALTFSRELEPVATVFDCMDELSAFAFAPADLPRLGTSCWHAPTLCSPAVEACTTSSGRGTAMCIVIRAASTSRISRRPVAL